MGKNTKFYLRVVRVQEDIAFLWDKDLPKQASKFGSYRNVLQIRLCAADSACSSNGLVKSGMNPSALINISCQSVCIGGF